MASQDNDLVEFGSFRVDRRQRLLLSGDQVVPLAPKAFDTLFALVENPGRILEKDELLKRIWPDTFVEEGSLARNVSILRKVLGESPDDQKYIQTVPKRGYRFVAPVKTIRGESGPTIIAEYTRIQAVLDVQSDTSETTAIGLPQRSRPRVAGMAGLLLAAAGAIAWHTNWGSIRSQIGGTAHPPRIESIAVLPLENLSRDPGQDYFADGMTDALITSLAQIHALKVISRTSVMHYKTTAKSLPEIARELGVDAILEGSVQRDGNRVRISAQLVRAATDTHLWAKNYDRDVSDLLQLDGEVAAAVAHEIEVQVSPETSRHLNDARKIAPAAQDEYLLARHQQDRRDETHLSQAIQHFEQAIRLEPNFAPAYAGLAHAWIQRGVWGGVAFREAELPSRNAVFKAIELDPNLAEAHAALAHDLMFYDWAWATAEQQFRRAIELDPNNVYARVYYASLLAVLGRFPEGIAEAKRALALDPLSSTVQSEYARVLFRARRYDEAIPHFQRTIELDSHDFGAYTRLAEVYEQTGRFQEALALVQQALRMRDAAPMKSAKLGRAYALLGRRADALNILGNIAGPSSDPRLSIDISLVYFALGDRDQGFKWLTKAFDQREMVFLVGIDPRFDSVRSDPRFQALVRRLGLPGNTH